MHQRRRPPFKLLVTAFEPFGGRPLNTSAALIEALAAKDEQGRKPSFIAYATLPVDFRRAWPTLRRQLQLHQPHGVLLTGEKSDAHFTLESMARNRRTSSRGLIQISHATADRIGSGVDVAKIFAAAKTRTGFSKNFFKLSDHAGTYLCNFIYYRMLSQRNDIPTVFVHVPALEEQQLSRRLPQYLRGLRIIRQELIKAIDGGRANCTPREN